VLALAARQSFIDRERIGIWGWSGGGSNTLNAIPGALCGNAAGNPDEYKIGSPINFADGLKGDLLIVDGTGDDNVLSQGTERLVNRAHRVGKAVRHPNRTHAISEGPQKPRTSTV
jgi:dipeptidyl-peptidase-4